MKNILASLLITLIATQATSAQEQTPVKETKSTPVAPITTAAPEVIAPASNEDKAESEEIDKAIEAIMSQTKASKAEKMIEANQMPAHAIDLAKEPLVTEKTPLATEAVAQKVSPAEGQEAPALADCALLLTKGGTANQELEEMATPKAKAEKMALPEGKKKERKAKPTLPKKPSAKTRARMGNLAAKKRDQQAKELLEQKSASLDEMVIEPLAKNLG